MFSQETSLYFFIFLEFIYLIFVVSSLFFDSKAILWLGWILAGLKYSISAFTSIDIITYNNFYQNLGDIETDLSSGFEIGFVALLYLAKALNLPLEIVHIGLVVFFLFTVHRLFKCFLSPQEANVLTLMFGFFPLGGELCIYLLRQLASTSLVILGLSFVLNDKKPQGLGLFISSLFFHLSSFVYAPFFIAGFVEKKGRKVMMLVGMYALLVTFFLLPADLVMSVLPISASDSSYVEKYGNYTSSFDDRKEGALGAFNIIMFAYFAWCVRQAYKHVDSSKILNYCYSSMLISITYVICELNRVIWMSSRIKFVSTMLIMSSNIMITSKFIFKKDVKKIFLFLIFAMFCFSAYFVNLGQSQHNLYLLP